MTFFLHWGSRFLVTFPQPPVPVLAGMELALRRADRELAAHLRSLSVGALLFGWPLLRSAFSEVLHREDWLRLMDRVLANADRPGLLEAAVVGFAVVSRAELLVCRSTEKAESIFRRSRQPPVDVEEMFRVMEKVSRFGAPPEEWSRTRSRVVGAKKEAAAGVAATAGDGRKWRGKKVEEEGGVVGGTVAALALLRSAPTKFQPLPVAGAYPYFDGYPQFAVNYQAELRERIVKQEHEKEHKCLLVSLSQGRGGGQNYFSRHTKSARECIFLFLGGRGRVSR